MNKIIHILILDDEQVELELISEKFDAAGIYGYKTFFDKQAFLESLNEAYIAIIDQNLGNATGFDIVGKIAEHNKERVSIAKIQVIIMSGTKDVDVPIYYLNNKLARFFANKNKVNFYDNLVAYTKILISEIGNDIFFDNGLTEREALVKTLLEKVREFK